MDLRGKKLILGSASPRRQQLMNELFGKIEVRVKPVDEDFPLGLDGSAISLYLAELKADAFNGALGKDEILITADTIVWFEGRVLNKPSGRDDAFQMLKSLSGNTHQVFTGVCISEADKKKLFSEVSSVYFRKVSERGMLEYIVEYQPYDKAGAYGAQECLPEDMNPLSGKEMEFLIRIGKPDLFEKSLAVKSHSRLNLIEKIEGSYFNVMGLPVVEVYEHLERTLR